MTLTVQDIKDAYTRTGLRPISGYFSDPFCVEGCALTAVAINTVGYQEFKRAKGSLSMSRWFADELNLPIRFVMGFMSGWDGAVFPDVYISADDDWRAGYELGQTGRREILEVSK